jgi:hypothetical protein
VSWDDFKAAAYVLFVSAVVIGVALLTVYQVTQAHQCHQHGGAYVKSIIGHTCIGENK